MGVVEGESFLLLHGNIWVKENRRCQQKSKQQLVSHGFDMSVFDTFILLAVLEKQD